MKRLTVIKPYSDNKLTWDETTQRYYLTFEYCKSEYDDNFADDEILKKRIKKNTKKVYSFIQYHVNSYNWNLVSNLLARTKEGREFIFEILRTQMDADAETGYNDLSAAPGINLTNGQAIDRKLLRQNQVSDDTEQVFDNNVSYFGINIGYQGIFPTSYFWLFNR